MRESTIRQKLSKVIKKQREKLDVSQEQLGELTGLHRNTIGTIERGESTPSLVALKKIAKALKITVSKLFEMAGL